MKNLSPQSVWVLLNHETSRPNKLALFAEYQSRGFYLERRWAGEPLRSRLCFRFSPADRFFEAKSYEEDVVPLLKDRMRGSQ